MNLTEKIVDVVSGEIQVIEREATQEEIAEVQELQARSEAKTLAVAEVLSARAALLAKLGITEEEAKLLLS